jgi:hypothetical protein
MLSSHSFMALLATPFFSQGVAMTHDRTKAHEALLEHLTEALSARAEKALADRIALRNAVCAFVAVEQSRGTPLERLIEDVTALLREAETEADVSSEELGRVLVTWCVEFNLAASLAVPPVGGLLA